MGKYNKIILVLSPELILLIGRRKEFQSLRFECKPFVRRRNSGLCVFIWGKLSYAIGGKMATENKNKLVE